MLVDWRKRETEKDAATTTIVAGSEGRSASGTTSATKKAASA
jgi:hypothetical protein